jgi:hypothetical protein
MKLKENVKREIIEIVATSFETGHFSDFDQLEMSVVLVQEYPKASKEELWKLLAAAKEYYDELVNLGPAGFYEEFKCVYDFDPMFAQEYGYEEDYYEDDDEDEGIVNDADRSELPWDYGKHFDD